MLGRVRRTSRADVGLALAFVGFGFLSYVAIAALGRVALSRFAESGGLTGTLTTADCLLRQSAIGLDILAVAGLAVGSTLTWLASRQRISISWAWLVGMCQTLSSVALGGILIKGIVPELPNKLSPELTSLCVASGIAIIIWCAFLVRLLLDRATIGRRGQSFNDGIKTNVYR